MSARVCRSCHYNVVSTVVTACPNCGAALPAALVSSGSFTMVALGLIAVAGVAAFLFLREGPGRPASPPTAPPSPASRPPAVAGRTRPAATPRMATGSADDPEVERLVARLSDPESAWTAAGELARRGTPRAEQALMSAYDRREFGKMAGAAAFYARKRPPGYEKVLVLLLHESKDLAVAQDLILSRDPKLAEPARKWAAGVGFKLVRDPSTPTGVTWTQAR
jgi:hypothetical protein